MEAVWIWSMLPMIVYRRVVMSLKNLSILNCSYRYQVTKKSIFLLNSYLQLSIWSCYLSLVDSKIAEQLNECLLLLTKWGQSFKVLLRHISPPMPFSLFLSFVSLKKIIPDLPLHMIIFSRLLKVSSVQLVAEWNSSYSVWWWNRTLFPKTITRPTYQSADTFGSKMFFSISNHISPLPQFQIKSLNKAISCLMCFILIALMRKCLVIRLGLSWGLYYKTVSSRLGSKYKINIKM